MHNMWMTIVISRYSVARQLMEELVHYIYRTPANNSTEDWKDEEVWRLVT